jgi:hypothetical protein
MNTHIIESRKRHIPFDSVFNTKVIASIIKSKYDTILKVSAHLGIVIKNIRFRFSSI